MDQSRNGDGFEEQRSYLAGLAYRMLGSVADAQDIVQDAFLRWHAADRSEIANPRAFLSTVVTRLCLDQLKSARRQRETYVGPWLPEPLIEEATGGQPSAAEIADDVSVALMLALERLSPLERAAFLLHDVFDMRYDQVAETLGRAEPACRKLAARARTHIRAAQPRYAVTDVEHFRIAEAFLAASRSGDVNALRDLLAEDVVVTTDGGGRKIAALRPVIGADKVQRFFSGLARKSGGRGPLWSKSVRINGLPGFASIEWDETLQTTALEIVDQRIAAIYILRNPEKVSHVMRYAPQAFGNQKADVR